MVGILLSFRKPASSMLIFALRQSCQDLDLLFSCLHSSMYHPPRGLPLADPGWPDVFRRPIPLQLPRGSWACYTASSVRCIVCPPLGAWQNRHISTDMRTVVQSSPCDAPRVVEALHDAEVLAGAPLRKRRGGSHELFIIQHNIMTLGQKL